MIKKLFHSLVATEKKESWLLSQDKILKILFYLLVVFLPTQFGKHFWPEFSFVYGLRLDYLSPTIYATDILIFIIIFLAGKDIINFFKKSNKGVLLFLTVFLFLGAVVSKSPSAAIYGIVKMTEFTFLAICVAQNFKTLNKRSLFIALSIPLVFESLLSFVQVLNNGSVGGLLYFLGERTYGGTTPGIANASIGGQLILRPYGTFSHPNVLAGFIITYLLMLLFLHGKNNRLLLFLILLLGTAAVILTLSRIAILFWITSLLFIFIISIFKKYKNRKLNIKKLLFIVISLVIIFSGVFKNTLVAQRFLQTKITDETFLQRQELMIASTNMFLESPVLGTGINNFYYELKNTALIQPVHNIFLLLLSQTGIFIFLIFMYLIFEMLKTVFKNKNIYLILIFMSFLVLGSVDHYFLTLQQGQLLTSLIFGTIFSYKIN